MSLALSGPKRQAQTSIWKPSSWISYNRCSGSRVLCTQMLWIFFFVFNLPEAPPPRTSFASTPPLQLLYRPPPSLFRFRNRRIGFASIGSSFRLHWPIPSCLRRSFAPPIRLSHHPPHRWTLLILLPFPLRLQPRFLFALFLAWLSAPSLPDVTPSFPSSLVFTASFLALSSPPRFSSSSLCFFTSSLPSFLLSLFSAVFPIFFFC